VYEDNSKIDRPVKEVGREDASCVYIQLDESVEAFVSTVIFFGFIKAEETLYHGLVKCSLCQKRFNSAGRAFKYTPNGSSMRKILIRI
jgi:hypothetical protein